MNRTLCHIRPGRLLLAFLSLALLLISTLAYANPATHADASAQSVSISDYFSYPLSHTSGGAPTDH